MGAAASQNAARDELLENGHTVFDKDMIVEIMDKKKDATCRRAVVHPGDIVIVRVGLQVQGGSDARRRLFVGKLLRYARTSTFVRDLCERLLSGFLKTDPANTRIPSEYDIPKVHVRGEFRRRLRVEPRDDGLMFAFELMMRPPHHRTKNVAMVADLVDVALTLAANLVFSQRSGGAIQGTPLEYELAAESEASGMDTSFTFLGVECHDTIDESSRLRSSESNQRRASPSESATLYRVGHRRIGNDDREYVVAQTSKGVRRWTLLRPSTRPRNLTRHESKK